MAGSGSTPLTIAPYLRHFDGKSSVARAHVKDANPRANGAQEKTALLPLGQCTKRDRRPSVVDVGPDRIDRRVRLGRDRIRVGPNRSQQSLDPRGYHGAPGLT
nr:hypothetical protein [Nitrosomonas nitrosa]